MGLGVRQLFAIMPTETRAARDVYVIRRLFKKESIKHLFTMDIIPYLL